MYVYTSFLLLLGPPFPFHMILKPKFSLWKTNPIGSVGQNYGEQEFSIFLGQGIGYHASFPGKTSLP